MSDLPYIPFYPSDFFAAAMFLPPRQRPLYAYLLLMQADHGKIAMTPTQISEHLEAHIGDVQAVLDSKFHYDNDLGGWINGRMDTERRKALKIIENKRNGAAKARARKTPSSGPPTPKKKEPEPEPVSRLISTADIKVDIKARAEEVYRAYPKRVSKPAAIRAITKALQLHDFDLLLSKTEAYAKAREGEDSQFTPYPATWFNNEGFNDDPSTWSRQNGTPPKPSTFGTV